MNKSGQRLGLADAAQQLRIPYQQAHRLLLVGVLLGTKRGGRWLVSAESVRRLAKSGLVSRLVHTRTMETGNGSR